MPPSALEEGLEALGRLCTWPLPETAKQACLDPQEKRQVTPGLQEKVQALGKSTAAKEEFRLRHLFQYQRADQFILSPQNFNRLIYGSS